MPDRRLILLRHAKAEPARSGSAYTDEMRELSSVGQRNSKTVGGELSAAGFMPDLVLCSPSVRTRQTWDRVAAAMKVRPAPEVEYVDELYSAGVSELVDHVRDVGEEVRTVLVVGHEPTMSAAAVRLAGPDSAPEAMAQVRSGLPTSTCAVLLVSTPWADLEPHTADLTTILSGRH